MGYNGWKNYETWNVALWMDNEQGTQEYWREIAQECWEDAKDDENVHKGIWNRKEAATYRLADRMKDEHIDAKDQMLEEADQSATMWADLLGAALSEVDWNEIAENILEIDELDEDEDEEEDEG